MKTNNSQISNIHIPMTKTDYALIATGITVLLFLWGLVITNFPQLPELIPIHYNLAGEVDNIGSKYSLLALPIIATILFFALLILAKFPSKFNFPFEITEENAPNYFRISISMIYILAMNMTILFTCITFETIQIAKTEQAIFGKLFLPLTILLMIVPIAYFLYKFYKQK